jgi:hypothetical protein
MRLNVVMCVTTKLRARSPRSRECDGGTRVGWRHLPVRMCVME